MSLDGFLKIRKPIFVIFVVALVVTFFLKNDYKLVSEIDEKVIQDPIQSEIVNPQPFKFEKEGIEYALNPLYDYEINGLIVNKATYDAWYSINETDAVFTTDLCMIWGENVESEVYKSRRLKFSQDMRFCFSSWWGDDLEVNEDEISNNHFVVDDEKIDDKLRGLTEGDQVQIIGKLVNVDISEIGGENSTNWKSSTDREDVAGGACEVIYIEKLNMLKPGNLLLKLINKVSFNGIIFLILFEIIYSFIQSKLVLRRRDRLGRKL